MKPSAPSFGNLPCVQVGMQRRGPDRSHPSRVALACETRELRHFRWAAPASVRPAQRGPNPDGPWRPVRAKSSAALAVGDAFCRGAENAAATVVRRVVVQDEGATRCRRTGHAQIPPPFRSARSCARAELTRDPARWLAGRLTAASKTRPGSAHSYRPEAGFSAALSIVRP